MGLVSATNLCITWRCPLPTEVTSAYSVVMSGTHDKEGVICYSDSRELMKNKKKERPRPEQFRAQLEKWGIQTSTL